MTLSALRYARILVCIPFVGLSLASCGDDAGESLPQQVINVGEGGDDGGARGCIQPLFPTDQPDLSLLSPPRFLLTGNALQSTVGQAQARPGDAIEAEVAVNGETRHVKVELADAWSPQRVQYVLEMDTPGNEIISLLLLSYEGIFGRFYMRLTLCGFDCDERQVIFDIDPDVNAPYVRTVIEKGETLQTDQTCISLNPRQGIGSGTILIQ